MVDIYVIQINLGHSFRYPYPMLSTYQNEYATRHDEYDSWDKSIEAGKSYLVGRAVPTNLFIQHHRSPLSAWQKLAYQWALENPTERLIIDTGPRCWHVYKRGEYVEFGLPHQDQGGERHYISNNGKSKILVNVD